MDVLILGGMPKRQLAFAVGVDQESGTNFAGGLSVELLNFVKRLDEKSRELLQT